MLFVPGCFTLGKRPASDEVKEFLMYDESSIISGVHGTACRLDYHAQYLEDYLESCLVPVLAIA